MCISIYRNENSNSSVTCSILQNYLRTIQSIDWLSPWIFIVHNARTATISVATIDWTLLWNNWVRWWRIIDAMTLTVLTLCWCKHDWWLDKVKNERVCVFLSQSNLLLPHDLIIYFMFNKIKSIKSSSDAKFSEKLHNFCLYLDMMDYCSGYSGTDCSMLVQVVHYVALCWLALPCIVYYAVVIDRDPLLLHSNSPTPFTHLFLTRSRLFHLRSV